MTKNRNPTIRDLTLAEVWKLLKRLFTAEIACAIVFILPYVIFILGSRGVDTIVGGKGIFTKWIEYLLLLLLLYYIVFYIHDLCSSLAEMFTNLANLTKAMSWIKRTVFAILLVSYFLCWIHFPTITFFVSALVVIPSGFTYDEYTRILRDKGLAGKLCE